MRKWIVAVGLFLTLALGGLVAGELLPEGTGDGVASISEARAGSPTCYVVAVSSTCGPKLRICVLSKSGSQNHARSAAADYYKTNHGCSPSFGGGGSGGGVCEGKCCSRSNNCDINLGTSN